MSASRRALSPSELSTTVESVTKLTAELVRIPSRSGVDSYEPIIVHLEHWLIDHGLAPRRYVDESGQPLALACDVTGETPGPRYVLDACIDTASFGDEAAWTHPPTSGVVVDGWLQGRGSADSKVAAAIFCHLAAEVRSEADRLRGTLTVLFDADEHSGSFGGVKAYLADEAASADVAGVMIGYPGDDEVIVGGRGFVRARIAVHGTAGHTGGRRSEGNAVAKAAELVMALNVEPLPGGAEGGFPLPSKLTVTAIHGGEGFSVIPGPVHGPRRCAPGPRLRAHGRDGDADIGRARGG